MRRALLALVLVSCTSDKLSGPEALDPRQAAAVEPRAPHITEIHYDNAGGDVDERIEVTAPAGMDLTGWTLVRYNGSNNTVYTTPPQIDQLGLTPTTCGNEGVQVIRFNVDGLQNGAPDGIALVDKSGKAVEFLSYEGPMTVAVGPAAGMTSTNIGTQNGTPIGQSLQKNGLGGWAVALSTFGACNDQPPPPYDGPTTVVINELMGAPLAAESESWGEWFEVYNYGTEQVNLAGWKIRSAGQGEHIIGGNVLVAPGGYAVLGRAVDQARNGDVVVNYNYFTTTANTIWLDSNDWLVLRTPTDVTIDSTAWTSLPVGATRGLRDASVENTNVDGANWGYATTTFGSGDYGTPGAANAPLGETAPPVPTGVVRITFSGRLASDPALPVGFEDQLFATARDAKGATVTTTIAWTSATPDLAEVDQNGVVRALGAGVALIRATAEDGRSAIYRVPTRVGVRSSTAVYEGNAEFGIPTDADASDELLIERFGYTTSYSATRNTPNWVSYDLEATHFGPEDRCDCFTADPMVDKQGYAHLTTADYTGAGAAAGFGIDRGHLMRSSDRTAASLDNAESFYLSNIIPQTADNNQGPWNNLEQVLNTRARAGNDEIYIIAGVAGNAGTLKGEGKVVIPASVWKVAVIMPRNQGVENVDGAEDFELIVVDMPNVPGIRNVDWNTYRTTVDAIEAKTGYDLLALLPDHVEWLIEAGLTKPSDATAPQLLTILNSGVQDLVAKGVLSEGNGNSLLVKLAHAQATMADGKDKNLLKSFENEVEAMMRSGRLDAATGGSLVTFAGWVANAL